MWQAYREENNASTPGERSTVLYFDNWTVFDVTEMRKLLGHSRWFSFGEASTIGPKQSFRRYENGMLLRRLGQCELNPIVKR